MVEDSVKFLKAAGLRVFFDAEHFFDGYKANPEFTLKVLEAAATNACCFPRPPGCAAVGALPPAPNPQRMRSQGKRRKASKQPF